MDAVALRVSPQLEHFDVDELEPLQGELKTLSETNFNKLRQSLIEKGFKLVLHVWRNGGVNYLIDGHQRVHVMQQLKKQGYEIPKLPCALIEAKNYREAKETVLLAVSQYGKIDKTGFEEFIEGEGFDLGEFDFPDFNIDQLDDDFGFKDGTGDNPSDADNVPVVKDNPYGVKRGDIWLLGAYLECDKCGEKTEYDKARVDTPCDCEVA